MSIRFSNLFFGGQKPELKPVTMQGRDPQFGRQAKGDQLEDRQAGSITFSAADHSEHQGEFNA